MAEGDPVVTVDPIAEEPGLPDLFRQLVSDARDVARAEADVVKARALDTVARYKAAAILFTIAGTLALASLIALLVGLILALSPRLGPGWATALVVGVAFAIVAVLALIGKARLSGARPR